MTSLRTTSRWSRAVAAATAGSGSSGGGGGSAFDPADFGAVGDGVADDRLAIQAAIDAANAAGGGIVDTGGGVFNVSKNPAGFYCLLLKSGVRLRGVGPMGTTLIQAAGIASSTSLLYTTGSVDAAISDLNLDGRKADQSADEHRHGVVAGTSTRLRIENVTAHDFTGDGLYLAAGTNHTSLIGVYCTANDRNGMTFGAQVDAPSSVDCDFIGNAVQQVDSETSASNKVTNPSFVNCTFDGDGVSDDYVLTCSGYSATDRGYGWSLVNCTINGPALVVWCDRVSFTNCHVTNATVKHGIYISRTCNDVTITGGSVTCTDTVTAELGGISCIGTGSGAPDSPDNVVIAGVAIRMSGTNHFAIQATGGGTYTVANNTLVGSGINSAYSSGIHIRPTLAAGPMRAISLNGNTIRNFGYAGILANVGAGEFLAFDASHNIFDDTAGVMVIGLDLDSAGASLLQATAIGNQTLGGVTTPIMWPAVPVLIGGNRGAGGIYSVDGTPEGALAEEVGAMAFDRSGGAGTTGYIKESGSGDTGWAAI